MAFRNEGANAAEEIFVVTSTIAVPAVPLSYSAVRSIFSREARLAQTAQTLESIRCQVPVARIAVVENSDISPAERSELEALCDLFIDSASPDAVRNDPNKGVAEAAMMICAVAAMGQFEHRRFFKLSGRYRLTGAFDTARYPFGHFGFLSRDNVYSTTLYSVPREHEQLYLQVLKQITATAGPFDGIEAMMAAAIPPNFVRSMPVLGVIGEVAVNGSLFEA